MAFIVGTLTVAMSTVLLSRIIRVTKSTVNRVSAYQASMANDHAATLGNYLVANGLILCKQDRWVARNLAGNETGARTSQISTGAPTIPTQAKCIWKGHLNGASSSITYGQFGLLNLRYEKAHLKNNKRGTRDVLTFTLKLKLDGEYTTSYLSFDLLDFDNKQGYDMLGKTPENINDFDKDFNVVYMTAHTPNTIADNEHEDIITGHAMRRPVALTEVRVKKWPECNYTCYVGRSSTHNASCRGLDFIEDPIADSSSLEIEIENFGPGPLYKAQYQKHVHYNKTNKLGDKNDFEVFDFYKAKQKVTGKDIAVLLPNSTESILKVQDRVTCKDPFYIAKSASDTIENKIVPDVEYGNLNTKSLPSLEVKYKILNIDPSKNSENFEPNKLVLWNNTHNDKKTLEVNDFEYIHKKNYAYSMPVSPINVVPKIDAFDIDISESKLRSMCPAKKIWSRTFDSCIIENCSPTLTRSSMDGSCVTP